MKNFQIFSRRTGAVDFRPDDPAGDSPYAQLRRLSTYLQTHIAPVEDITDCDDALFYYREYCYRKLFTGTSHEEFIKLDEASPDAVDWLIAVHNTESDIFRANQKKG